MANIQMIDPAQAGWDEIFNQNLKLMGNGSTTYSDTGYVNGAITLLNGITQYSDYEGDTPSYRIIQSGSIEALILKGSIRGFDLAVGNNDVKVATFPTAVFDWLNSHKQTNGHWSTTAIDRQLSWRIGTDSGLYLNYNYQTVTKDTWGRFDTVFVA
ncbi:hypothetical protein [Lactiplantibacillus pingfangensis]|uniref:hypothetical protein n=1 Tax=Lactiplantibacillus pingfangensis TaxID=2559915 RepID=UPI0010F6546E|nr:hypothetical protein [Lactiplantibacillus pingfangensis]